MSDDEQSLDVDWRKLCLMNLAEDGVGGEFSSLKKMALVAWREKFD